jgi:hypothetical protein
MHVHFFFSTYITRDPPSLFTWIGQAKAMRWRVQVMKSPHCVIVSGLLLRNYVLPVIPKYRSKYRILEQPPSLNAGDQFLHPDKTAGKVIVI